MPISRTILKDWNVLVVDDESDSLEVIQRLLHHYSATVRTATNGRDALIDAKAHVPKLIISDISMPIMDGWGLIDALKRDPMLTDIPAIALTAHAMPGDRVRAISVGFHNYLSKPLTPATFMKDLLRLLIDMPEFSGEFEEGSDR